MQATKGLGSALFFIAGAVLFIFEIYWFNQWWGGTGVVIAVLVPPVAAFFPLHYFAREDFSVLYFGIWAAALAGMGVASLVEP
jgi:hypothetical protein